MRYRYLLIRYLWGANRWLSIRFSLLSALFVGMTGYSLIAAHKTVDAALAGFALTFSLNISTDMLFLVRRWTSLELAMVAVERIKEYSEVAQEVSSRSFYFSLHSTDTMYLHSKAPEIIEPRPPAHWPSAGTSRLKTKQFGLVLISFCR